MASTARTVRVEDELWEAAASQAEAEGITISEVLRAALQRYTGRNLSGLHQKPTETGLLGDTLIIDQSMETADPEKHRLHIVGCNLALRGMSLVVTPNYGSTLTVAEAVARPELNSIDGRSHTGATIVQGCALWPNPPLTTRP
ncbi:hypothetical protein SEA_JUJU_35 [Gordonia phage JuJu]|uniref:Uncharacterized protein n=1 Tax=Gordonia phage JuJu TaxID=2590929 RepID=A0A516KR33_9CAUD|nr:hypothetical protein KNU69_gp35 [Gordonia phage JuJu]QDP44151.1 hypothetical protein SEA_JUJU_35 [Gordonia phage JuJu]